MAQQFRVPGWFLSLFLFLGLGIGVCFSWVDSGPTPANAAGTGFTGTTSLSSPASCSLNWRTVPSPNPSAGTSILSRLSVVSANDVWAVGSTYNFGYSTLAEHWDGIRWTIVPTPNSPTYGYRLVDVKAISSNNIWAVAQSNVGFSPLFIIRWNGSAWSQVTIPNFTSVVQLYSIDATSANNIWVAGEYANTATGDVDVLTLHWNGSTWTQLAAPKLGNEHNHISRIRIIASNNIWAAGYYSNQGTLEHTYMLYWNGTEWVLVSTVIPQSGIDAFYDLDFVSANDIWAVGFYFSSEEGRLSLTMHWNGTGWTIVPSPTATDAATYLVGVKAISANNVVAVGYHPGLHASGVQFIITWNGTVWTQANYVETASLLLGVDAVSSTNIWAVGTLGGSETYTLHYSTDCALPTFTPVPTNTPAPTLTFTPSPTNTHTPIPTNTPTPLPPRCPGERFTDVCPGDYFYQPVLALNDAGTVAGYNTAPPCPSQLHVPCYLPYNNVSRGQSAKIVSLAAGFHDAVSGQLFEDIPPGSTFYDYVQRLADRGLIAGYPCGGVGEQCGPNNLPYFRQNASVTRGQLSKMTALSFGFQDTAGAQTFEDVIPNSTFYEYVQALAERGLINGYPCGSTGEPCGPSNLPYFRPGNPVTRGQTAKILYLAQTLGPPTPTPTATAITIPTYTPTELPTNTPLPTFTPEDTATTTPTATSTP